MSNRTAEVFDLQAYRARKVAQRESAALTVQPWIAPAYGMASFAPSGFAVGYFVLWPTWVFVPQRSTAS